MSRNNRTGVFLSAMLAFAAMVNIAEAQKIQTETLRPLADVVKARPAPFTGNEIPLYVITWGGDVATILADQEGLFQAAGLNVKLECENDVAKQLEAVISGKTPFFRGTMGMANAAIEAAKAQGIDLVAVYQLTWSTGGDCLVVRPGINKPEDLRGKTVAVQLYGPHMDYIANILTNAGVDIGAVKFKWFKELTIPKADAGAIIDPVQAFQNDPSIDAVMCIVPDALTLTSQGKGGTGADGSVKGAQILVTTKTADRIIADVYLVRSDWLNANRSKVEKFVNTLMKAEEMLRDYKSASPAKYQQLLTRSADLLLGASQATGDVEAMLADCTFAGYQGNVAFFTGAGTLRTFNTLNTEINRAFGAMGLVRGTATLTQANWDYKGLAAGLKFAGAVTAAPKFDSGKVAAKIEQMAAEAERWEDEGTLFVVEISFAPNQNVFQAEQYAADFQKALELSQTFGGAIVSVEGHADPKKAGDMRAKGAPQDQVNAVEQAAKNLSLLRAQKVRDAFIEYCRAKGINVDVSQFAPVGMGIKHPKFPAPKTETEWRANMRVVFRVKNMEAELSEFTPSGN